MSELVQIHLSAKECSGRGVRFRVLTPSQHNAAAYAAASQAGKECTYVELRHMEFREGIKAMLVEVTEPGLVGENALQGDVKWTKLDAEKLEMPGPLQYDRKDGVGLFTAKDIMVLVGMYKRFHEVSEAEVEDIAGKAVKVSVD